MRAMTSAEADIHHQMASLRLLYWATLTYIFKVKHLKCYYLENDESYTIKVDIRRRVESLWLLYCATLAYASR